jgi:hypothetical protein
MMSAGSVPMKIADRRRNSRISSITPPITSSHQGSICSAAERKDQRKGSRQRNRVANRIQRNARAGRRAPTSVAKPIIATARMAIEVILEISGVPGGNRCLRW